MNWRSVSVLFLVLTTAVLFSLPLPAARADDCGCVGATQTFRWGDTITEDCVLNGDLDIPSIDAGHCFRVGANGITIDGGGHRIRSNNYYYGIEVNGRSNVTIRNIEIETSAPGSTSRTPRASRSPRADLSTTVGGEA